MNCALSCSNNTALLQFSEEEIKLNYTSHGKLKASPADAIKTLDEIKLIKDYFLNLKQYRNYALFMIGISTAYRCGDLLRLKFSDLFSENGEWREYIDIIEKKTRKKRKMPITESIKNAMSLYIDSIGGYYYHEYLFKSRKGINNPLTVSSACEIFITMSKNLKLNYHCSTHFLRKTFAYWFLQTYKNDIMALCNLQEMLGHFSPQTTLAYCGVKDEIQMNMANSVSALWE